MQDCIKAFFFPECLETKAMFLCFLASQCVPMAQFVLSVGDAHSGPTGACSQCSRVIPSPSLAGQPMASVRNPRHSSSSPHPHSSADCTDLIKSFVWFIFFHLLQTQSSVSGGLPSLQVPSRVGAFLTAAVCTHSALAMMTGLPCQQNLLTGTEEGGNLCRLCVCTLLLGGTIYCLPLGLFFNSYKSKRCTHKYLGNICLLFPAPWICEKSTGMEF